MKWVLRKIVGTLISFALLVYGLIFILTMIGFEPITATSNNMCEGLSKGNLCFTYEKDTYKKGDIIALLDEEDYNFKYVISSNEDGTYNVTGDTEDLADAIIVSKNQIIGKLIFGIPFIGYLVFFLTSVNGTTIVAFIIAVLIVLCIIKLGIKLFKKLNENDNTTNNNSIPTVNVPETRCAGAGIIYNDVQEFWKINYKPPHIYNRSYDEKVTIAYDILSRVSEGNIVDWLNKQPSRFVKQLGLSFLCDNAPEEEIVDFWERVVEKERELNN